MFDPVLRSHTLMIDARRMSGSGSGSSVARSSVAGGVPIRANNPFIVEGVYPGFGQIRERELRKCLEICLPVSSQIHFNI